MTSVLLKIRLLMYFYLQFAIALDSTMYAAGHIHHQIAAGGMDDVLTGIISRIHVLLCYMDLEKIR